MSVGYNARMSILQSLLRSRAKDAVKRWVAVNDSSGLEGLESIFAVFLELWEELGVYQAARQEEENQIFKTKKKTTSFETDEVHIKDMVSVGIVFVGNFGLVPMIQYVTDM